jgi:hypothetical protein
VKEDSPVPSWVEVLLKVEIERGGEAMIDLQGNPIRWKRTHHAAMQVIHACRRASERYGFEMTQEDYEKLRRRMIEQFRDQTGIVFLSKQTKGRSRFAVWHGCEWIPLVYDKKLKNIVTFLPKRCLLAHKDKLAW